MARRTKSLLDATIQEAARELRLPSVSRDFGGLADTAARQKRSHREYLLELLESELQDRCQRRQVRRVKEARFPYVKTLESFQLERNDTIQPAVLADLQECGFVSRAENVIFLGDCGTGKTHLAIALGMAACQQGRRVRFVTVAGLVNELFEARDARQLGRVVGRYARYEVLVLDEFGYLPLAGPQAELLFQVLTERHERASLVLTTNLPFGEWTSVIADVRLCKALIDRLTHRAIIIDTGTNSVRLAESLAAQRKAPKKEGKTRKRS